MYFSSGISCARGEPAKRGCQNFGSPDVFVPVDCSEVTLKVAAKECDVDDAVKDQKTNSVEEGSDCYNNVDWSWSLV